MRVRGLGVAVLFAIIAAPAALATDYYADPAGGSWTSNTTWRLASSAGAPAAPGTYPGSAAGDRAIVDSAAVTVTLSAALPNSVTLQQTCSPCTVVVAAGGALPLAGNSSVSSGATVLADDTVTFTGPATMTNRGTWRAGAGIGCSGCTGRFHNAAGGEFLIEAAATITCAVRFDNDGSVRNSPGAAGLVMTGGGTHTGEFLAGTGGFSFRGGHALTPSSLLMNVGGVSCDPTIAYQGTIVIRADGSLFVGLSSTCTFDGPVTTPRLTFSPGFPFGNFGEGRLAGSGPITITGTGSTWPIGSIIGTGTITIAAGADLQTGGGNPTIVGGSRGLGRTLINHGTLTIGGNLFGAEGAIVNTGTTTVLMDLRGNVMPGSFTNQGGRVLLGSTLNAVHFPGRYRQTGGTTTLSGNVSSPVSFEIDGGSLLGYGIIFGSVDNRGTIAPGGAGAAAIRITGNYTQFSTGALNADIGSPLPGSHFLVENNRYDQLVVEGTATLAGTVDVNLINGWMPSSGSPYDLVTAGVRNGTFATLNFPPYPPGRFIATYLPNAFRVSAQPLSDLAVTKTGPPAAVVGQPISFDIQVSNFGPSRSIGVSLGDPTPPNLTFLANAGDCITAFPCELGNLESGQSKTIIATYVVTGGAGTHITNTATVSSVPFATDPVTANNTASATLYIDYADVAIIKTAPTRVRAGGEVTFTIAVANSSQFPVQNVVVADPTPAGLTFVSASGACTTPFPCSLGTIPPATTRIINATYSISGSLAGSRVTNTATVSTTTSDDPANNTASATFSVECLGSAPDNLAPTADASGSGTLAWRGNGSSYVVYLGPAGSGCETEYARTTSRSVPYGNLAPGTYEWRVESLTPNCRAVSSACVTFTVTGACTVPDAPRARVVGQATSAKTYTVEWDPVAGAVRYELEESLTADFADATRLTLTGTAQSFKHDVAAATAFYYRVRAFTDCVHTPGPDSPAVRVVIVPLASSSNNAPAGSEEVIVQEIFIPGEPSQNLDFSATTDRPWLTVRPAGGVLTPAGITLEVIADPKSLPNGTFTGTVIVTITGGSGNASTHANATKTVPISINLVTPVTAATSAPSSSPHALIIPSAGHLDGIDSHWRTDLRLANTGSSAARYLLTFIPSGDAAAARQTTITVAAGATAALDDVIGNWFGLGMLGDGANGMLEILPLDGANAVASSRTYNDTGRGTLGQYIPAVPLPGFIGRGQVLTLQQIAQNATYRTNVGLAEGAGAPVSVDVSVFDAGGAKLADIPVELVAGEQRQMNHLLADHGIELADGRIEVRVTGGDGRITAYASVVDSASQDPLLVSGELLGGSGASRFVLPGVANLFNGLADWRTDMRVFNGGTSAQPATLIFFPFNNGPSKTVDVLLGAGQVTSFDNILQSRFGIANTGGAVHLITEEPTSLVVSGRTYNQTSAGTFGQFIPAVTEEHAVGAGGRTLQILQVEDSTRYRTNVGIVEVTGKAAVVELQVITDSITTSVQIPLAPNELRQFNPIRDLGLGHVYNARITVRVVGGEGRVTAYASVIDELSQDPTLIPAQ